MPFKQGWLYVVAILQITAQVVYITAGQHFCPFFLTQFDVGSNLVFLYLGGLCTHHYGWVQRVAHFNGFYALDYSGNKGFINIFLYEQARRAGTDLALVQSKQYSAFNGFIEEFIVMIHH
ncbi:hypothetical protein D9M68_764690 [compost metagenome]